MSDGSYTNPNQLLRNLPAKTTLIGRIRKDAKLRETRERRAVRGRKRFYGEDLPTPQQIRRDPDIPWITVQARGVSGKWRDFEVKTLGPIRWRAAWCRWIYAMLVIRPVGYRLRQGAR